jgi:hypothetical protein
VAPPSLFVMTRSGAAAIGVVSDPVLFPGVGSVPPLPSSAIEAELESWLTPAGTG